MANDAEWVEDVRRWYFAGSAAQSAPDIDATEADPIGYEAAHPALQSRHWPDAPSARGSERS